MNISSLITVIGLVLFAGPTLGSKAWGAKPTASSAKAASPSITSLVLVNTLTQQPLRSLVSGGAIDLATDGASLNIKAEASGTFGSVAFSWDGVAFSSDNTAPYALAGDNAGVFKPWTPTVGTHTIRAVTTARSNGTGAPGTPMEITIVVTNSATPTPLPPPPPPPPPPTDPLVVSIPTLANWNLSTGLPLYDGNGNLNLALYDLLALSYDKSTMEMRFGPSFSDLSPNAPEDRPTLFKQTPKAYSTGYIRVNPYELGAPVKDNDYWSDSGQVGYVPDVVTDPGLDRIQTYAYYDHVFSISPRLDYASGKPHPDAQTQDPYYATLFGELPKYPIAMQRNYGMQQNESLVIYRDGNLGVAGTQTSRAGTERPYPGLVFPAHKVPTSIAVTTANEFALVTIWDIETKKGQLAVIALEGKYLAFHTWPYMAMPNQGSWSKFKLLGYIDLPMAMPTSVAAASNGWWSGPSQTNGLVLSQIDLTVDSNRQNLYDGGAWSTVVANGGYAIVASKHDNMAVAIDLSALFKYVRTSYLGSATSYQETLAARGTADTNFPQAFSVRPDIAPKVVWQMNVAQPTCVLAGMKLDRWSKDFHKAYVASADGTIHVIDTSLLMWRNSWEQKHPIAAIGAFSVGRNPTSMCFTRRKDRNLPLIPLGSDGTQYAADPLNNTFFVAVRGDRKVVAAVTWGGQGAVYRTIQDSRMGDPVTVSTAVRGPILSVADFRGRKIISFRMGTITDTRNGQSYGAGADGTALFEFAGELPFQGYPFLVNSSNVN